MKYPAAVITILWDLKKSDEVEYTFLFDALNRIKTGASKDLVEKIRATTDKAKRNEYKAKLPCVLFSGQFMRRNSEACTQHSGYIILDFDDLMAKNQTRPEDFRDNMVEMPWVYAAFISPSGTGVKVLVKIPDNKTAHKGHFKALENYFSGIGYQVDPSGKDVSRVCYESYDPDIYINTECDGFTDYVNPDDAPPPIKPRNAGQTDYGKLNICATMIRKAEDGQKHHMLVKAATLAGGFIAAGLVREEDAIHVLESEIQAKSGVLDFRGAQKTIRDQIEYGKHKPIFDHVAEEAPLPKASSTASIRHLSGVWETMQDEFRNGKSKGETTHMPDLDENFKIKMGELTVWTGYPNSGKSEFVLQIALLKSILDGWKWAVFSPESYPENEFYDGLIHSLVGKSVDRDYANIMTETQYREAASFIQDHFYYIYPETAHTIEEIESNFDFCINEYGVKGVIVDPFNQLSRDFSMRDDQYLEGFLTKRKRYAINHQIAYWMMVHPKGDRKKNKDGEYDVLGFYDLSGGAMWANKIDNLMVIRRPFQESNPKSTVVEIHAKKIKKQRLVGIPGSKEYTFDRGKNRYYRNGKSPLDNINSEGTGDPRARVK